MLRNKNSVYFFNFFYLTILISHFIELLAFDIESPQNFDSTALDNFTICCAATLKSDVSEKKTWFNRTQTGTKKMASLY